MSEESTHPRSRGHSLNNTLSVSLLIFCARCLSMLPHASLASQMRHSDVTLVSVQTKRMADIVRYPSALRVERSDFGLPRSHDTSHPLLHLFLFLSYDVHPLPSLLHFQYGASRLYIYIQSESFPPLVQRSL